MKKFGVYSVLAVSAFSFVSWISPLKVHAGPVTDTLKFDGTTYNGKGGNSLGGYSTYPYYFTINGNTSTEVPLLCVSFQYQITSGESWDYTIAAIGTATPTLTAPEEQEDAYLDSLIPGIGSGPGSSLPLEELQWAAWMVGDSNLTNYDLQHYYHLSSPEITAIDGDLTQAAGFVTAHPNPDATFYAGYELFVPIVGSQSWGGTPQTFIAPVPEPSSLILLGSGLLAAAGALYRRKRRTA
jgi:hypothetical protein